MIQHVLTRCLGVEPSDKDYRQLSLTLSAAVVCTMIAAFFCGYNTLVKLYWPLLIIDMIAVMLGLLTLFVLLRLKSPQVAKVILLLMVALVCFSVMEVRGNQSYSLAWAFLCPPLSIFLLGYIYGTIFSGVYLACLCALMLMNGEGWEDAAWQGGAFTNLVMIYLGLFAFACHYEASRRTAQKLLRESNEKLAQLAHQDPLTGLYNRRYLEDQMLQMDNESIFLAMVDVDDFKRINDAFGHEKGDQVLTQMGDLLRKIIGAEGVVGRWGGEEFVILHYADQPSVFIALLERLVTGVAEHSFSDVPPITISVGATTYYKGRHKASLRYVDDALYDAKESGKNRYAIMRHVVDE